jgi:probable phosphoglycerate mutase
MEVFFIRHGETECNRLGIVQGCGVDSDLNHNGRLQGKSFFEKYKDYGFELVITSHLKRSIQTVMHFEEQGVPFLQDHRLREISWGEHEGKAGEPELMEKYMKIIKSWSSGMYHAKPVGGESAEELGLRISQFTEDLLNRPEKKILVCTHGRTLRALVCQLNKLPLSEMEKIEHQNTGLYRFLRRSDSWHMIESNNTLHLQPEDRLYV